MAERGEVSLLFLEEMHAVDLRIRLVSHLSFTSIHPSIHPYVRLALLPSGVTVSDGWPRMDKAAMT